MKWKYFQVASVPYFVLQRSHVGTPGWLDWGSPRAVAHFAGSSVGCFMVVYRVRSELSCPLPLARLGPGVRQLDSLRSIAGSDLHPWD